MASVEGEMTSGPVEVVVFDFVADQSNETRSNPAMVRAEKDSPWADRQGH